jgi:hypothetical protein
MKTIYFVTEGTTDQIVLEGLVGSWMGQEDFVARHIQPPASDFLEDREHVLSNGWKGVLAWCQGKNRIGPTSRDEVLRRADCLIVHLDADVARDPEFKSNPFAGKCPPARSCSDWVRQHLLEQVTTQAVENLVLCVPAQALEAWLVSALHPNVADDYQPIECRDQPESLLVQRPPYRLVRTKGASFKKETGNYRKALPTIVARWPNAVERCPEAARFEAEAKVVLGRKKGTQFVSRLV